MSADIRIGNGFFGYSEDTLLGYGAGVNNRVRSVIFDSKRFYTKHVKNKDGYLENIVQNQPAIDYELNSSGALRIERAIATRNKYSEDFTQSEYFTNGVTPMTNAAANTALGVTSPKNNFKVDASGTDKLMKIFKLQNVSGNNSYIQFQDAAQGQRYVVSCFFKKDNARYVGFEHAYSGNPNKDLAVYDFDSNTFVKEIRNVLDGDKTIAAKAISYANGWVRLVFNFKSISSTTALIRLKVFQDANGLTTAINDACFITGFNVSRSNQVTAFFKSYQKCVGALVTNGQDTLTRVNNTQYMLPKLTANPARGLTWTFKFILNEARQFGKIALNQTGGGASNKTSIEFETYPITDSGSFYGGLGLRIKHNLTSSGVLTGKDFINPVLNTSSLVSGVEYHVGFTYTDGFLRFSVNGQDANAFTDGSTPETGATRYIFSPTLDTTSTRQINDIRIAGQNSQINPMPLNLIDMALYDKSSTQSELNFLTLQ